MPAIKTKTNIRTKLMQWQLQHVVEVTVADKLLKEIIEYCLPQKSLKRMSIEGVSGNDIHAKMAIFIDYNNPSGGIDIETEFKDKTFVANSSSSQSGNDYSRYANCPVWEEAIAWFSKLCREHGLEFKWSVAFYCNHEEIMNKFDLSWSTRNNKAENQNGHNLPHSKLSELTCGFGFSSEKFGGQ